MKIHVVLDYCLPHHGINTRQVVKTTEALFGANGDTTLMIPEAQPVSDDAVFNYYEVQRRFPLQRFPSSVGKVGLVRREKLLHPLHVFRSMQAPPDILLTRAWPTAIAALKRGIPTWYETYKEFTGAQRVFLPIFRMMTGYTSFRGIITHSENSAASLRQKMGNRLETHVVHNGCDAHRFDSSISSTAARDMLGWKQQPTVLYAGHFSKGKGLRVLPEIAARTPELQYALVGYRTEAELARVRKLFTRCNATNVAFYPWCSPSDLRHYLYAADMTIIPPDAKPFQSGGTGLPIKIYEYWASGRVLVAPDIPKMKPMLKHGENAWLVSTENMERAAMALRELLNQPSTRQRISDNGQKASERYTWARRGERLLEIFSSV